MAKSVVQKGKALVQSKTFWFNILAAAVAIAALFGFNEFEISPQAAPGIALLVGLANIALRLKTKEPIARVK